MKQFRKRTSAVIAIFFLAGLPVVADVTTDAGDIVVSQTGESAKVRFTIITAKGYVGFTVPKDWRVVAMQTKPPVTATAFIVPNTADRNTPDSTNVAIGLIEPNSEEGKKALDRIGRSYEGRVTQTSISGWDCFSQEAHQKSTQFTILDARKNVANVIVSLRVAWPHLTKNSAKYDEDMKVMFESLMETVDGNVGTYPPKPGDVVRRPDK